MKTRRTLTWLIAPVACVCLLSMQGSLAQDANSERIENARVALEKWVETKRIISQERREWATGRELLESRLDLVRSEIEELRKKISSAEESIAEADKKREELLVENVRLKEASASLVSTVLTLEQRTQELLSRLPDPVQERVKPLSQRFPEDAEETRLSLGERFQNVVGVLNEINKFNREITITSEVRTLPNGSAAEVQTVYVGIAYGYYTNAAGDQAGVGRATADGWTWTAANDAAPEIVKMIAILKDEQPAEFVRLPVVID